MTAAHSHDDYQGRCVYEHQDGRVYCDYQTAEAVLADTTNARVVDVVADAPECEWCIDGKRIVGTDEYRCTYCHGTGIAGYEPPEYEP